MRIIVQRVKSASVTVVEGGSSSSSSSSSKVVSRIGPGIMALVGLHEHDQYTDLDYCCKKLLGCKLWENDDTGAPWRQNVKQKKYQILCVSQFTLYGTLENKKHQPDYKKAMKAVPAQELYDSFLKLLRENYPGNGDDDDDNDNDNPRIQDGVFGAMMDVELINDGPVTLVIESNPQQPLVEETRNT